MNRADRLALAGVVLLFLSGSIIVAKDGVGPLTAPLSGALLVAGVALIGVGIRGALP